MAKVMTLGVVVYLIFGAYFINSSFGFIVVPDIVLNLDKWITLVGGILILVGGINYFRVGRKIY